MTETSTEARITRKRSVGFPFLSLGDAVTVIRKAGRQRNEHTAEAFAHYLGHETTNSGSFKRNLAALRDWGLITGTNERVVLTELAQRIAFPTDDGLADFREAFDNCAIFARVYEDMAKGEPYPLQRVANAAIRYGVNPASKDKFARSFTESAVTAGLAEMDGGKVVFLGPGSDVAVQLQDSARATDQMVVAHAASAHGQAGQARVVVNPEAADEATFVGGMRGAAVGHNATVGYQEPEERPAVLHQQSWDFQAGNLVFEIKSSRSLPASAFMQIGKVMSEIEKLKDMLTEGSAGSSEAEEPAAEREE